jgi:hypothetical protein
LREGKNLAFPIFSSSGLQFRTLSFEHGNDVGGAQPLPRAPLDFSCRLNEHVSAPENFPAIEELLILNYRIFPNSE